MTKMPNANISLRVFNFYDLGDTEQTYSQQLKRTHFENGTEFSFTLPLSLDSKYYAANRLYLEIGILNIKLLTFTRLLRKHHQYENEF